MRQCRKRQREQNFEAYRNRVNAQKRQYRLRIRFIISTESQTNQNGRSIAKTRRSNKKRQRRCRKNQSEQKKNLIREKDRLNKRLKRQQQKITSEQSSWRQNITTFV